MEFLAAIGTLFIVCGPIALIVAFVALGVLLLGVSLLYRRQKKTGAGNPAKVD